MEAWSITYRLADGREIVAVHACSRSTASSYAVTGCRRGFWHDDEFIAPGAIWSARVGAVARIVVNGVEHEWAGRVITYAEVVRLAGKSGQPTVVYYCTRSRSGTMWPGSEVVFVEPDMIFNVAHTDNA